MVRICETFCNRYLRQQIPNSVNGLEYLEAKPARLGGAGKFCCSIAGEEVDGKGKKTRARVKSSIGRRVVILSSRYMPEKFYFKSWQHIFICHLLRSLRAKRLKKRAGCQARSGLWAPVDPIAYYVSECHRKSCFWYIRNCKIGNNIHFKLLVVMCKKVKMVERKEISTGDCWSAGNIPGSPEGIATHNLLFLLCGKPYKT